MYSSAIRSPTTRTVLPLNRSTAALRRWGSNISGHPGPESSPLRPGGPPPRGRARSATATGGTPARRGRSPSAPGSTALPRAGDDVDDLVAHDPRAREIQPEVGRGAPQEARLGLPAVADDAVRRRPLGGVMDADVEAVQVGALGLQLAHEGFVHGLEDLLAEVAARHAALVRHHHGPEPRTVEAADGFSAPRKEAKAPGVIDVPHFLGQGSVAVDEDCRLAWHLRAV